MIRRKFKFFYIALAAIYLGNELPAFEQNVQKEFTDSLTLSKVIAEVSQNYPSVKEAEEALNAADAKIELAKSGYYPDVSASASYSRIGPVPSLTFPGLGTFQFYPADNYSAAVNYRQNILDFGKTAKSISQENQNKNIAQQSIVQVKQRISILAVNCFYTLLYLQDAISIKDEEIQNLQEHLKFIRKKEASGSATQFEILTTQVKISTVENQKTDLKTAQKVQASLMNSLLGQPENTTVSVKNEIKAVSTDIPADSLISYALRNRDELKIESEKETLAKLKYETVKSQNNPDLSIFASAGGKNGYIPNLNTVKANYVAGISLNVPIFDANRRKYNLMQVKSSLQSLDFETETMRRSITNEVVESEANLSASQQKIDEFELQLAHADKAFALAQINYKEGTITNLDLLDATTTVAESRLLLLKAKIDYIVSAYKVKAAIGERLY